MKQSLLTEIIKQELAAGGLGAPGELFLTVRELAAKYCVSLQSASGAVRTLADEGLVTLHGKRYYLTNGYAQPSTPYGQILRENARKIIGLDLNNIDNPYFSSLAERFSAKVREHGYSLMIQSSNNDCAVKLANLRRFRELGVSGIFAVPNVNINDAEVYKCCPLPLVVLGRDIGLASCDTIIVENELAGAQVAKHLTEIGCRSYAYLGLHNVVNNPAIEDYRLLGFRNRLLKMGIELCDILAVESASDETLAARVTALVRSAPKPLGLFCFHDLLAAEAVRAIKNGCRGRYMIPDDVAIVGFDDLPIATMLNPTLTTVAYRYDRIVDSAMARMLDYIENPRHRNASVAISSSLTIRQSSMRGG